MRSPFELKENVSTLEQAQRLYTYLGSLLMAAKKVQRQQNIDRTWRKEAVLVRRELMDEYGPVVRTREDQYMARRHVTVPKPEIFEPPYISVLYYEPRRGEIRRVLDMAKEEDRRDFLSRVKGKKIEPWDGQ